MSMLRVRFGSGSLPSSSWYWRFLSTMAAFWYNGYGISPPTLLYVSPQKYYISLQSQFPEFNGCSGRYQRLGKISPGVGVVGIRLGWAGHHIRGREHDHYPIPFIHLAIRCPTRGYRITSYSLSVTIEVVPLRTNLDYVRSRF